jgi:hypothetical protein
MYLVIVGHTGIAQVGKTKLEYSTLQTIKVYLKVRDFNEVIIKQTFVY